MGSWEPTLNVFWTPSNAHGTPLMGQNDSARFALLLLYIYIQGVSKIHIYMNIFTIDYPNPPWEGGDNMIRWTFLKF